MLLQQYLLSMRSLMMEAHVASTNGNLIGFRYLSVIIDELARWSPLHPLVLRRLLVHFNGFPILVECLHLANIMGRKLT